MWEVVNDDPFYADYDMYFSISCVPGSSDRDLYSRSVCDSRPGFTLRLTIDKQKKVAYVYIKGDSDDNPEIFMSEPATVPMWWAVAMAKSAYRLPPQSLEVSDAMPRD